MLAGLNESRYILDSIHTLMARMRTGDFVIIDPRHHAHMTVFRMGDRHNVDLVFRCNISHHTLAP